MTAIDVNAVFARAEAAYQAGRHDAARVDVMAVLRVVGEHAAVLHLLALVEKRAGEVSAARLVFERALAAAPEDAEICNNYANLLKDAGDSKAALQHYDRALAMRPSFHAARFNRALLLQTAGRQAEALADLNQLAALRPNDAKLHTARGAALWSLRQFDDAAEAYERAIRIEPRRVALHGRALVARQLGEPSAAGWYRDALAASPGDREIILGLAETLEADGDADCIEILAAAVAAAPTWWSGQAALARMRWEAGDAENFTRGLQHALTNTPDSRDGWLTFAGAFAAADRSAAAADTAAAGRAAVGDDAALRLLEAVHASEAGQIDRADALYAELPGGLRGRSIHEARHRLRTGDVTQAVALVDGARDEAPWDIGVWAMTGICWRLLGDARAGWLFEQRGFIAPRQLEMTRDDLLQLAERLRGLHRSRAQPLGQSLRGGTQTRGRLFDRREPEIDALRLNIVEAVQAYWGGLPALDASHPLLRHRETMPQLAGSWSVRLTDGGFHVAHMHPEGVVSSACYIVVPQPQSEKEGWLEIGGAPDGLVLPIEPLQQVEPRPGHIVLFPSYCYHGTRPFSTGERLSVAFDFVA